MNSEKYRSRLFTTWFGFLIPFGGMLIVMEALGVCPFGTSRAFLYSDAYHQYYPFFLQFRNAVRSGSSLVYNWDLGMGVDYLGLIAYYLGSPLNLLAALVPDGWVLQYYCLLMPLKLGLAGMFFTIFLKRLYCRNDMAPPLFGAMYALCAWALGYQWNIMWLDTFALLPLVMLGMTSLLKERRFLLYCIALALSVAANYYIGLFTCYFVFLTFFCYEICRWQGWKRFFADFFTIGVFSLLALGLSAVITLPGIASLLSTQSSVNTFPTGFRLNIASTFDLLGLLDGMRQVAGNMGGSLSPTFKEGLPNLYCGVGILLLAFMFLLSREVTIREKLCSLFLLLFFMLSFLIRQLDYVWHGFHFPNMIPYRFSFLFSFVLIYMAYRAWLVRRSFDRPGVVAAVIFSVAVLGCSGDLLTTQSLTLFETEWEIPVYIVYNAGFLLVFGLILFLHSARFRAVSSEPEELRKLRGRIRRRRSTCAAAFCILMAGEVVGMLTGFGCWFPTTSLRGYPKGGEDTASMVRVIEEREADREFSRTEMTHAQTLNDAALNGYSGISAFTSSANIRITEFMKALGYGAKNTYNRYCYEESSPVADLFLNIKYMIDRDRDNKESTYYRQLLSFGAATIYENNYRLPLGFLAESALGELEFSGAGDSFDFQNQLFSAATGLGSDVWHMVPMSECEVTGSGTEVEDVRSSGYCTYTAPESGANVIYSFRVDRSGFACIRFNFPKRNDLYISVNGVELYHETTSLPQMLAVTDVQEGDYVDIRIVCKAGESGNLTVVLGILDQEIFEKGYSVLSWDVMKITSFTDTRVEAVVEAGRDGLLYTSIPQNGNWQVYADGEPADVTLVGGCMIAVPLDEGCHTLEFVYVNRSLLLGVSISAAALGVLILLFLLDRLRKEHAPSREEQPLVTDDPEYPVTDEPDALRELPAEEEQEPEQTDSAGEESAQSTSAEKEPDLALPDKEAPVQEKGEKSDDSNI